MSMSKPRILICEGAEDQALIQAMIESNLIPDDFEVRHIGDSVSSSAAARSSGLGITGIRKYLEAFAPYIRGRTRLGIQRKRQGLFIRRKAKPRRGNHRRSSQPINLGRASRAIEHT